MRFDFGGDEAAHGVAERCVTGRNSVWAEPQMLHAGIVCRTLYSSKRLL
jgi:hypothetical protein